MLTLRVKKDSNYSNVYVLALRAYMQLDSIQTYGVLLTLVINYVYT